MRTGLNELQVYFGDAASGTRRGGIVLQRSGFATWRLTGLRLPRN